MPKIFGWQHIVYLIVACALCIGAIFIIRKFCKTEKQQRLAIQIYSAILLVFILANRILIAAVQQHRFLAVIPNSFCGITSLCFAICGLCCKKDDKFLHWIVYCGLLGGLLTMIYPDFIGQAPSIFYHLTITGLVHHTLAFFLGVTMISIGWFKPSLKRWAWLPLGLTSMMTYGQFLITTGIHSDAMYINEPLISGTPFTWWFTGILFLVLHIVMILIFEYVYLRKSGKRLFNKKAKATVSANEETLTAELAEPQNVEEVKQGENKPKKQYTKKTKSEK